MYLACASGGYDLIVRNQVGLIIWWVILVGTAFGVLPLGRPSREAWLVIGLLGAFVVWSALAVTWSVSPERSLQEVSRLATYLGVLVLAVMTLAGRSELAHTVAALACAVAVVATLAVLSRLVTGVFPDGHAALPLLGGAGGRLSWPLNYWNALAALCCLGVPLLLSIATSGRHLWAQAVAAAVIPIVTLCAYLTLSRGGAVELAVACVVFVSLSSNRIGKLPTLIVAGAGSAVVIGEAARRHALEHGLATTTAHHQGTTLLAVLIVTCVGVAGLRIGVQLLSRRWDITTRLRLARRHSLAALGVTLVALLIVALAVGVPHRLSHAWLDFKTESPTTGSTGINRYASLGGEGRYTYWRVAIDASSGHVLTGSGPGTFQLLWLPRAPPDAGYATNAHSLYVETYAEVGLIGLLLLLAFFTTLISAVIRRVAGADPDTRTRVAAVAAACLAFLVGAAFDWLWQMPVLPVAVLILAASVVAPNSRAVTRVPRRARRATMRVGAAAVALAALVSIAVPLGTASEVQRSQAAVTAGRTSTALADARAAIRLEPYAASPELQAALVLELRGDLRGATVAARRASENEPTNWQPWFVLSRLDAERGLARASVAAYVRARSLNPRSSLFAG